MTLRRRLIVASTLAVALAVAAACAVAYLVVRTELRGQVDDQLTEHAAAIERHAGTPRFHGTQLTSSVSDLPQPGPRDGGPIPYVQVIDPTGRISPGGLPRSSTLPLRIDERDRDIARRGRGTLLRTIEQDESHLRLVTVGVRGSGAVQLARPTDEIDEVLSRTRLILALVCAAGIGAAALLGRAVTRRVTAPLREVVDATKHIARTEDLDRRLDVRSRDEVGELAQRFNLMLDRLASSRGALADSARSQRQLVADASHELRTPITSLRTNIEVLIDEADLDEDTRRQLLADVLAQTEELGDLVADIIELARGDEQTRHPQDVRLDLLLTEAVQRARRHHPTVTFTLAVEPRQVDGDAPRLDRAIGNLLDNAAKHGGGGSVVDVAVDADGVSVRDHGAGLNPDDLPHLFDRFYRGVEARGRPGTGLGLAIVRQAAVSHGGTVIARNAEGGGARFLLALDSSRIAAPASDDVGSG